MGGRGEREGGRGESVRGGEGEDEWGGGIGV